MNNFENELSEAVVRLVDDTVRISDKYGHNRNDVFKCCLYLIDKMNKECKLDYYRPNNGDVIQWL